VQSALVSVLVSRVTLYIKSFYVLTIIVEKLKSTTAWTCYNVLLVKHCRHFLWTALTYEVLKVFSYSAITVEPRQFDRIILSMFREDNKRIRTCGLSMETTL